MNVQSTVERPEIYMLARCTADKNQLMYGELRLDDIKQLPMHPIEIDGTLIHDEVRFFKGTLIAINTKIDLCKQWESYFYLKFTILDMCNKALP